MIRNPWKVSTLLLAAVLGYAALGPTPEASADRQPVMRDALRDLQKAARTLDRATPDKGGHRVKAIELTKQAIAEVEAGIEFDNHH